MTTQKQRAAKLERDYRKFAREYREGHPNCEVGYEGCDGRTTSVHHLLKRSAGGALTDPTNCVSACTACHGRIHDNPKQATADGWLTTIPRLSRGRVS